MKRITKNAATVFLLLISTATQVHAMGARRPRTHSPAPAKVPPPPLPVPHPLPPTASTGPYVDQITSLAGASACANYSWKNRGRAPVGYINGIALSFARSLCRLNSFSLTPAPIVQIMSAADSHNDAKDALTHYTSNFSFLPVDLSVAGTEPLRAVYVLGMGLGMRESSGAYCEGWDKSAGSNRSSSGGEAGLFQTSYDSMVASWELAKLYAEYKSAASNRCFLNVFKQQANCSNTGTLGSGAGADFQNFSKACPAFATEYAMTLLRILRGHYGPINRREAEVIPACDQLLKSVQDLVNRDPQIACQDIY